MDVEHLFQQASQAHRQGDLPQAEQLYRQVLAQAPNHADGHHLLGLVCSQQGRHAEAVQHIQQAIHINEGNAVYQHNLGEAWRRQERLVEAYLTSPIPTPSPPSSR